MRHLALILILCPTLAAAQTADMQSMARARDLGTVLASEKLCSLTLDPAGIEAWIAANVAKDDLSFASTLQTMTMGQQYQQKDMTAAAAIAHCAAVKQSAATMGLIK